MVNVILYGVDQFVAAELSKEMLEGLANLYEIREDDVIFTCPDNAIYHKGIDQTSWNVVVYVDAPMKAKVLQHDVEKYICAMLQDLAIHITIRFSYYSSDDLFVKINATYPRYLDTSNTVEIEEQEDDEQEIFDGNIFKDFNKDL